MEHIAGLVGLPRFLHSSTANKTNLEVAKVFTIIDPRKPLPETVNVQFDSGKISRVLVSSPWMPPVCDLCKEIGHITKRCPIVPKACTICGSLSHVRAKCNQKPKGGARVRQEKIEDQRSKHYNSHGQGKKTRRGRSKSKDKQHWVPISNPTGGPDQTKEPPQLPLLDPAEPKNPTNFKLAGKSLVEVDHQSKLGTRKDEAKGETSGSANHKLPPRTRSNSVVSRSSHSDVQPDSSDVESSDSELEEGEFSNLEPDFELVRNRKQFSGQKGKRGRGPKLN